MRLLSSGDPDFRLTVFHSVQFWRSLILKFSVAGCQWGWLTVVFAFQFWFSRKTSEQLQWKYSENKERHVIASSFSLWCDVNVMRSIWIQWKWPVWPRADRSLSCGGRRSNLQYMLLIMWLAVGHMFPSSTDLHVRESVTLSASQGFYFEILQEFLFLQLLQSLGCVSAQTGEETRICDTTTFSL